MDVHLRTNFFTYCVPEDRYTFKMQDGLDDIFHLLAGTISNRIQQRVLSLSSKLLDEKNTAVLQKLWSENLREYEGLPTRRESILSPKVFGKQSLQSKHWRYTELVDPIGLIEGCSGKPASSMLRPVLGHESKLKQKLRFDYALRPVS